MFDVDLYMFEVHFKDSVTGEYDSATFRAEDEQHAVDLCCDMYPNARISSVVDLGAAF